MSAYAWSVEVGEVWDHVRHDVRLPRGLRSSFLIHEYVDVC